MGRGGANAGVGEVWQPMVESNPGLEGGGKKLSEKSRRARDPRVQKEHAQDDRWCCLCAGSNTFGFGVGGESRRTRREEGRKRGWSTVWHLTSKIYVVLSEKKAT